MPGLATCSARACNAQHSEMKHCVLDSQQKCEGLGNNDRPPRRAYLFVQVPLMTNLAQDLGEGG
jgi:hypothetical protein